MVTKGIKQLNKELRRALMNAQHLKERTDDVYTTLATYTAVVGIELGENDEELVTKFRQLLVRARMSMGEPFPLNGRKDFSSHD